MNYPGAANFFGTWIPGSRLTSQTSFLIADWKTIYHDQEKTKIV